MSTSPRGRYRDALRQRDFAWLAGASLVNEIASWAYTVVLAVDVYDRTHSTVWLAGLASARWSVGLVFGGYAGLLADRYERTRVMIGSALFAGVVMAGIAVAVGVAAPIGILVALNAVSSLAESPYRPAAGALTPEIVGERDLAAANGLFATLESLQVVLGPAVGGLLLLTGSKVSGVVLNTASFFVVAAMVTRLRVRSHGHVDAGESFLRQWSAGFRALAGQRVALALVAFCALDSMVYGASTVINAPLSVRLGTGVNGYSYLLAGNALGGVIAAGLANRLSAFSRLAPVIGISILLQSVPFAATAFVHSATPAFALQVVSGVGMVIVDVLAITALQRDLDGSVMSRVLGAFDAIVIAAILVASYILAAVVSVDGVRTALLVTGIGVPVLAAFGMPLLIRGDRESAAEVARLRPTVELLSELDLFAGASHSILERLAKGAVPQDVVGGTVVIRQGEAADALWILVAGSLAVSIGAESGVRELPAVTAPAYVGELGLVREVARTATVTAVSDCRLLRIEGAEFLKALETSSLSSSFQQISGARWAS